MNGRSRDLKPTAPGPDDIRYAQVISKYEEFQRRDASLTVNHISKKIAAFFIHIVEISKKTCARN